MSQVTTVCEHCSSAFEVYKSRINTARFCSLDCKYSSMIKNDFVIFNGDKYFLQKGTYYFNYKIGNFLHRVVWESVNGPIPDGYLIHHIDHDKLNNNIENLQCMTVSEHISHHNKYTPTIGLTCTVQSCNKKYAAKGLCSIHYGRKWRKDKVLIK